MEAVNSVLFSSWGSSSKDIFWPPCFTLILTNSRLKPKQKWLDRILFLSLCLLLYNRVLLCFCGRLTLWEEVRRERKKRICSVSPHPFSITGTISQGYFQPAHDIYSLCSEAFVTDAAADPPPFLLFTFEIWAISLVLSYCIFYLCKSKESLFFIVDGKAMI